MKNKLSSFFIGLVALLMVTGAHSMDLTVPKIPVPSPELIKPPVIANNGTNMVIPPKKSYLYSEQNKNNTNTTSPQSSSMEEMNNFIDGKQNIKQSINPVQFGLGKAGNVASERVEEVLSKYGTSRVTINGVDNFKSGSLDWLIPLNNFSDDDKHLIFTQLGARRSNTLSEEYRTTINVGFGYRYFTENNWMVGVNAFYDHDITRNHQRIGIGAEAWTDNFKFSANAYRRLSNWKDSPTLINYQERPANGFDIRAEGSLPSLPQVSGKVVYEKYYGNEVGLFGENARQKDPSAVTVSLNYKPVPLLSIGVDHRMGQDGKSDTKFNITLNYQIGVPMSKQLDSSKVGETRKLSMSRTDLVERNNEIVLEYKIKPIGSIKLPNELNGNPLAVITFPIVIVTNTALSNYTWIGSASPYMSPYVNGSASGVITLPVYSNSTTNTYTLQLTAKDVSGRLIQSNVLNITVDGFTLTISPSKPSANADGVDSVTFTTKLTDKNNIAVPNKQISWVARNATIQSSQTTTDANGEAKAVVTSLIAAIAEVDATDVENGTKATGTVNFTGNPLTAMVFSLTNNNPSLVADGISSSVLTANVKDSNGNVVGAGVTVNWTTTAGSLASATSNTDNNGNATMTLTSPLLVGTATVTAKGVVADPGKTNLINFVANTASIKVNTLIAPPTHEVSTTNPILVTAEVTDANGNAVGAGYTVNWTGISPGGGSFLTATSITDSNGMATNSFMAGTVAGTATLNAKAGTGAMKTVNVQLLADPVSARVVDLNPSLLNGEANGVTEILFMVKVADGYGNIYTQDQNVQSYWTTTLGTLLSNTATVGANSRAMVVLQAANYSGVGTLRVKANASDPGLTSLITYVPIDQPRQDDENYIEYFSCGSPTFDTTEGTYLMWDNVVIANGLVQLPYTAGGFTYSYFGTLKQDNTTTSCGGGQTGYRATSGVRRTSQ